MQEGMHNMELIKTETGYVLDPTTMETLKLFEQKMQAIKKYEDDVKKAIKAEMEAKGIVKIESDDLVINYIQPTDRETFDAKKLRQDNPDLYDQYVKISKVASSIRIKVKQ